jgi:hypothetical protein
VRDTSWLSGPEKCTRNRKVGLESLISDSIFISAMRTSAHVKSKEPAESSQSCTSPSPISLHNIAATTKSIRLVLLSACSIFNATTVQICLQYEVLRRSIPRRIQSSSGTCDGMDDMTMTVLWNKVRTFNVARCASHEQPLMTSATHILQVTQSQAVLDQTTACSAIWGKIQSALSRVVTSAIRETYSLPRAAY